MDILAVLANGWGGGGEGGGENSNEGAWIQFSYNSPATFVLVCSREFRNVKQWVARYVGRTICSAHVRYVLRSATIYTSLTFL